MTDHLLAMITGTHPVSPSSFGARHETPNDATAVLDRRVDTASVVDEIAQLVLNAKREAEALWDRATPADRERMGGEFDCLFHLDQLADRLMCHADVIQAECDDAAADSQKDAA